MPETKLTPQHSMRPDRLWLMLSERRQLRLRHGVSDGRGVADLGFFGLDVLLVYWAFRINYRSAAPTRW